MTNEKDNDELLPEIPGTGMDEEVNDTAGRKKQTGEIKLKEIPGLAELEAHRKTGRKSSTTSFTWILLLLLGFSAAVYFLNKYREDHILATLAEETPVTVAKTRPTAVKASADNLIPSSAEETKIAAEVPGIQQPDKQTIPGQAPSGKAALKFKGTVAIDYLISRKKVGRVEVDMPIIAMKAALPGSYGFVAKKIEFENDYYTVIKVLDENKTPLFYVNEKDSRVWGIQIISDKYKTAERIGIGSTLGNIKMYYSKPKIWSAKGSAPLVSVSELDGVFVLQDKGVDIGKGIFPDSAKIESILIGGSPFLE